METSQTYEQALDEAQTALCDSRTPTPLGELAHACFMVAVTAAATQRGGPFDPKELYDNAVAHQLSALGMRADLARKDPVNMGAYANVGRLAGRRPVRKDKT